MPLREWRHSYHANRMGLGLRGMYWHVFLRGMGMAMMGLFFPIFIFSIGYDSAGIVAGLRLLLVYLLVERFLISIFSIVLGKFIERIGLRWSVLLGTLFAILFFVLPVVFGSVVWVVLAMAFVSGLATPLYWNSRFTLLSLEGRKNNFGKEQGLVLLLVRGAGVLSPAVGGVVLSVWGFGALFSVGSLILLFSSVPVFLMTERLGVGGDGIAWNNFFEFLRKKKNLLLSFAGESWETNISGLFWPIYLFLVVGSYETLGAITAVAMVFSLVMFFVAGWVFDKKKKVGNGGEVKLFVQFSSFLSILRILRASFSSFWGVFALDLSTKLISPFYYVPYGGYMLEAGKRTTTLRFFVYRELIFSISGVVLAVLLLFVVSLPGYWWYIFSFSALGLMLSLFISKTGKK